METSQHYLAHNLGSNGFNGGVNGFNGHVSGVPMATNGLPGGFQSFAGPVATGHSWQQQPQPQLASNGRCDGFGGPSLGFGCQGYQPSQQQNAPSWVQRKRSRDDDDDDVEEVAARQNWAMMKRQRSSFGDFEANVTICNINGAANGFSSGVADANLLSFQNGHQALPTAAAMQYEDSVSAMNTSAVEHATSVSASRGYDAMYSYNLMLSEVYGC